MSSSKLLVLCFSLRTVAHTEKGILAALHVLVTNGPRSKQPHLTHMPLILQQSALAANVTTLPATTTGTASGGTETTVSTAGNEETAETATGNATASATSPAGTENGTETANHATETVTATAMGGVVAVRTTKSTHDVIATMTADVTGEEEGLVEVEAEAEV